MDAQRDSRVRLAGTLLLVVWLVASARQQVLTYGRLISEYGTSAARSEELNTSLAQWLAASTPADSTIASREPGVLRYFSGRNVHDLRGFHTPAAFGLSLETATHVLRPAYVIAPASPEIDSWPESRWEVRFSAQFDQLLGHQNLTAYRLEWERDLDDPSRPYLDLPAGASLIAAIDVGKPADEKKYLYDTPDLLLVNKVRSKLSETIAVEDDGRARITRDHFESFRLSVPLGKPLLLVARYNGLAPAQADVLVDGQAAGTWSFASGRYRLAEDKFVINSEFVTSSRPRITIQYVDDEGITAETYHFWIYTMP